MEPQQQMNQFNQVPVSNTAPEQNQPLAQNTKTNQKNKYIIVIIFLAIAAVAGLGFGIYEFCQISQKDEEVKSLQAENSDLKEQEAITLTEQSEAIATKNPIIAAGDQELHYAVLFESEKLNYQDGTSSDVVLNISVENGEVSNCYMYGNNFTTQNCTISGLSGKIYKIVEAHSGHVVDDDQVAFIMEDGTVEYFALPTADGDKNFTIKGRMGIDGFVTDAISANVYVATGYTATIFVLSDGSLIEYSESLLQ